MSTYRSESEYLPESNKDTEPHKVNVPTVFHTGDAVSMRGVVPYLHYKEIVQNINIVIIIV